jgi:hypothetical protein
LDRPEAYPTSLLGGWFNFKFSAEIYPKPGSG